jgi:hypothetical protein
VSEPVPPASKEHRSPLGAVIDSLSSSYKQLLDATLALNVAEIPYATCGGFAVAAWCFFHEQQLLEASNPTRIVPPKPITLVNTRDVDMVVWRKDLERIVAVMGRAGFHYETAAQVNMFVRKSERREGRRETVRHGLADGIHLLFASETTETAYFANPEPEQSTVFGDTFWGADYSFRVLNVEQLIRTKLNSLSRQRLKDLVHLVELWESGAITDEAVRKVAVDPQWLKGGKVRRFHDSFRQVVAASAESGLRRYAMRGQEIADLFDALLQRAVNPSLAAAATPRVRSGRRGTLP